MLCSELFESYLLVEAEIVDVCNTVSIINPSPHDMARMLTKASILRALSEPGRFAVWPAEDALHQSVQIALGMSDRARRYQVFSSPSRSPRTTSTIGRFHVYIMDSDHTIVQPNVMNAQMRVALGVR